MWFRFLAYSFVFCAVVSFAQTPSPSPDGNLVQLGDLKIDKIARTISFPVSVNLRTGLLEYALVTEAGKMHESLLVTKIDPAQLHAAALLLGVKVPAQKEKTPPSEINQAYLQHAPKLRGVAVEIFFSWTKDGHKEQTRLEDLLLKSDKPVKPGPWLYNGSAMEQERFLAQLDGSVIALVTDPAALINNPRPGSDNDQVWSSRTDCLPAQDTVGELSIRFNLVKK